MNEKITAHPQKEEREKVLKEMRRMWGAVYPRFQPGQILPGMCRTHEAGQRRKAQAKTTGEMSRFRG